MFQKIVWLTGMPRSGTNWLSQIFASHPDVRLKFCPLFSYEFKNALDKNSSASEWRELFTKVYRTKGDYLDQEYLRRKGFVPTFAQKNKNPSLLVIKSTRFHNLTPGLLEKCPEIKWIGIVRNPCASIFSWISNPLEFPSDADSYSEWRTGQCRKNGPGEFWGFEGWKMVASMFLSFENKFPDRFRILSYKSLVQSVQEQTRSMFAWLGLNFPEQTAYFLRDSQGRHVGHQRAVFKSPASTERWRRELDPKIKAAIMEELTDTPLARFLAPRPSKKGL
jgi:hypothetical protein